MPDATGHGVLYVEGKDDCHALVHLLARHGVVLDENDGPVLLKHKGSDSEVVDGITVAVKGSGKNPVGFVVDSDVTVQQRWAQIRPKLAAVEVELPNPAAPWSDELPVGGFVARTERYDRSVGVWIMPNNRTDFGKIEDLVATLVPADDAIFDLAKRATTEALGISASGLAKRGAIQPKDELKGQLHSWLAWREKPAMSIGLALKAEYFEHESDVANAFVAWFKRLYGLI